MLVQKLEFDTPAIHILPRIRYFIPDIAVKTEKNCLFCHFTIFHLSSKEKY